MAISQSELQAGFELMQQEVRRKHPKMHQEVVDYISSFVVCLAALPKQHLSKDEVLALVNHAAAIANIQ